MNWNYVLIFMMGFFSCAFLFFSFYNFNYEIPFVSGSSPFNVNAPSDWINENDIVILEDSVILRIPNVSISRYAPTGSMRPVLDNGANGLRIVPESEDSIKVGDIVSFRDGDMLIVHRVAEKGVDDEGVYFITKGDNNNVDDGKVRFKDIEFVTIGVIW